MNHFCKQNLRFIFFQLFTFSVFQKVKTQMASCGFRKVASNEPLKNCVCRKVSLPPGRSKRGRSSLRRIFTGNAIQICGEEGLYSTTEAGLFYNISDQSHLCSKHYPDLGHGRLQEAAGQGRHGHREGRRDCDQRRGITSGGRRIPVPVF